MRVRKNIVIMLAKQCKTWLNNGLRNVSGVLFLFFAVNRYIVCLVVACGYIWNACIVVKQTVETRRSSFCNVVHFCTGFIKMELKDGFDKSKNWSTNAFFIVLGSIWLHRWLIESVHKLTLVLSLNFKYLAVSLGVSLVLLTPWKLESCVQKQLWNSNCK